MPTVGPNRLSPNLPSISRPRCSRASNNGLRPGPPLLELAMCVEEGVVVAHKAQFDYGVLAHEFAHVRSWVPVSKQLCTLALNRLGGFVWISGRTRGRCP